MTSHSYTLGIDNGSSGSVAMLGANHAVFASMPTKDALHGRAGKMVKRIDVPELMQWIKNAVPVADGITTIRAYVERPFTGSAIMINTSLIAARSYEAVLIALESLGIGHETIDSRDWQKTQLPGVTGSANLKKASFVRGKQLYPSLAAYIDDHGDADGLLIAHYFHHFSNH